MFSSVSTCCTVFQSTPSAWRVTIDKKCAEWLHDPFQSTPSAWRVTHNGFAERLPVLISIHTLRVEGDLPTPTASSCA